jgi:hypothetical protein
MLILFAAFMLSIAVAQRLRLAVPDRQARVRKLLPIGVGLLGAATVMLVSTPASLDPIRRSLATFIEAQGGLSTVVVLLLAPFALRRHRTAALASMTWMAFILLCEFLPPNAAYPLPILDAPLARMAFFLPLCSLGGLGVSGIDSSLRSAALRQPIAKLLRVGVAFGLLAYLGRSFAEQSYAPSECCVLARQDDVTMARLASDQLPNESLVLIASQASEDPNAGPFPVDGGRWLSALTPIRTIMRPAGTDLAAASQHALLCGQRITHVYVGGAPGGFSRVMLDSAPALYARRLSLPGAAIYAVTGCGVPDSRASDLHLPLTLRGNEPELGRMPLQIPNGAPAGQGPLSRETP